MSERAKEITAFATPYGLYQYKVMPFGMKNAPATFQRLINRLIADIDGCEAYIDDVIIYSNTWETHLEIMRKFFQRLREASLTINLVKSEFGCGHVTNLGHIVGQAGVPIEVFSDHNPLVFIHRMKDKNQRLLRWSLILSEYNMNIQHIKGQYNVIADCLSRP